MRQVRAAEPDEVDDEADVRIVIDGHAPGDVIGPARIGIVDPVEHRQRHERVADAHASVAIRRVPLESVVRFLGGLHGNLLRQPDVRETGAGVHEVQVHDVDAILDLVEVVSAAQVAFGFDEARAVEDVQVRKRRRPVAAEIGEHEPEIRAHRIGRDGDFFGKARFFGGLFDALSAGFVLPAVVVAPDAVAFDPAGRKLRAAVRAIRRNEVRCPRLTAKERERFAHDPDRLGGSRRDVVEHGNRQPKAAQVAAG